MTRLPLEEPPREQNLRPVLEADRGLRMLK